MFGCLVASMFDEWFEVDMFLGYVRQSVHWTGEKEQLYLQLIMRRLPFAWFEQFQQSISWNGAELIFFVIKLSQEGRRDFHYQCCSFYVIYKPGKGWSAYDCRNCATEKRNMTFGSNILVKCFNCLLRVMKQTFDSLLVLLYQKKWWMNLAEVLNFDFCVAVVLRRSW